MLQLKSITKSYTTGEFTQKALDEVSVSFRRSEFVAILGPSGSGKTTFLNVVGGLDRYDSGDLIVNGKSTKQFTDGDWDAYRNNTVGFIFQSYNLITHLDVLANVEMGMTLSGLSDSEKRKRALEALEKVGLSDHIHKKPGQLSGGQMQRVAIARALSNDPDVILADEPTGALDSATGEQIMQLIKEIAGDKLVIMVTHNPKIAEEYADRIISFEDGKVVGDTAPFEEDVTESDYKLKRTAMSFRTAIGLSGRNITTKKGRTLLTAFASSIGIIGIALILALSDGFKQQIEKYEGNALNEFPIIISQMNMTTDEETMEASRKRMESMLKGEREFADTDYITLTKPVNADRIHVNNFSDDFMKYVESIDKSVCSNVGYTRLCAMNVLRKDASGEAKWYSFPSGIAGMTSANTAGSAYNMSGVGLASYPVSVDGETSYLEKYYDLLAGSYPASETDAVIVVDSQNSVEESVLTALGYDASKGTLDFKDVIGTEFKLVGNDVFYEKSSYGFYVQRTDYDKMYDDESNITVKVSGIIRLKEGQTVGLLGFGIAYSDELVQRLVELNSQSALIKELSVSDVNITEPALSPLDDTTRKNLISTYGGSAQPFVIYLYPGTFEMKDALIEYLDKYNEGKSDDDSIIYMDLSEMITEMTGSIMDAVTLVLVAFASISLVVSLIMIAIITYISVLERTKEIGILRALGARKRDITRVFNAETFIIGLVSGTMGIIISYILIIPINIIIEGRTELPNVAKLSPIYAIGLIALSLLLTVLGGMIPAKMAANKDPVSALRSE